MFDFCEIYIRKQTIPLPIDSDIRPSLSFSHKLELSGTSVLHFRPLVMWLYVYLYEKRRVVYCKHFHVLVFLQAKLDKYKYKTSKGETLNQDQLVGKHFSCLFVVNLFLSFFSIKICFCIDVGSTV